MNDLPFPTTPDTVQPQWVDHLPKEEPVVEEPQVEVVSEPEVTDAESDV